MRRFLAAARRDERELEHVLGAFERDLRHALEHCHHHGGDRIPATVTVRLTSKENSMSETTFEPGQTIYASAEVDNAGGTPLQDAGTWSTTAGTISADPTNPLRATIVGVPDGDVTATYTASNGVVGQASGTVTDDTPATVTVTLSSTAPADETPASA